MKPKKEFKKLTLKKETIHNLSDKEMHLAVRGGTNYTNCQSWCPTCSPSYCPCHTIGATDCYSCAPCQSVDTGCEPNCTIPACPA